MKMQHALIAAAMLSLLFRGLIAPLNAQPADDKGPCGQIRTACREAGFTFGGAEAGIGLFRDCIVPIMQGGPQPPRARIPLPRVDGALVSACKASNPRFGQGGVPPQEPRLPANAPLPEETTSSTAANAEAERLGAWRTSMSQSSLPKSGCFEAEYPSLEWREVPCITALPVPYDVGNHYDFVAQTTGLISRAVGSFGSVTGVASVQSQSLKTPAPPPTPNAFSLQLNSNRLSETAACTGRGPDCHGWQQFLFGSQACPGSEPGTRVSCAYIQYWLIGYGDNCPFGGKNASCFHNSPAVKVPGKTIPITDLAQLQLIGTAAPGGNDDVAVSVGGHLYRLHAQSDDVLGLGGQWNKAEFNVFGDCCSDQAVFNWGSALVVNLSVEDGTKNAPNCINPGINPAFTGESNNLNFVGSCHTLGDPNPGITFTESYCNSCGVGCCDADEFCFDPKAGICKPAIGGGGVGPGGGGSVSFPNCGTADTPPCNPTLPGHGGVKAKTIE